MSYKQWLGRLRREGYKLLMENSVDIGEGTYCVSGAWRKEGTIYISKYSITLPHSFQENTYTE